MLTRKSGITQIEKRRTFQQTTKHLFAAIIAIYSKVFYMKTKLMSVKNAELEEVFGGDNLLFEAFQNVWRALPGFCQLPQNGYRIRAPLTSCHR